MHKKWFVHIDLIDEIKANYYDNFIQSFCIPSYSNYITAQGKVLCYIFLYQQN